MEEEVIEDKSSELTLNQLEEEIQVRMLLNIVSRNKCY